MDQYRNYIRKPETEKAFLKGSIEAHIQAALTEATLAGMPEFLALDTIEAVVAKLREEEEKEAEQRQQIEHFVIGRRPGSPVPAGWDVT